MSAFTDDGFLNGRLVIRQPRRGFRAGLDAVVLAAAVPAAPRDSILELGAGVGTASLCLASRVTGCSVLGVEVDPVLVALADHNAQINGLSDRVRFAQGDALARRQGCFDHVFCNPPFHDDSGRTSPDAGRARALHDRGTLKDWLKVGLKRVGPKGTFTVILRAGRMGEALAALPETEVCLFPLWQKAGAAATRVIIQLCFARRAAPRLLPGLVLHTKDGAYTAEAEAVLRTGMAIACS